MKKNKDEKRRLLLNKRLDQKTIEKKRAKFARPADSKLFVKTNGSEAVRTPLNKRLVAIILAIVMVVGLIPAGLYIGLKGRAAETEDIETVTMDVRANGAEHYTTAEIASGTIARNIPTAKFHNQLPNGAQFQKALVVDSNAGTETEIASVGAIKKDDSTNVYYSLEADSNSGTLLKEGQTLVLVMASKYAVTKSDDGHGSVTTSAHKNGDDYYVWGGENLRIQVTPDQDYKVKNVTYTVGEETQTVSVKNNAAIILAGNITGDISIAAEFEKIEEYTISEVQTMTKSVYYPNWVGADNHGGITNGEKTTATKDGADPFSPGEPAVFYIYSESSSGGNTWLLNMLSVNGIDLAYPTTKGGFKDTPYGSNNNLARVTMLEEDTTLNYKGDPTSGLRAKHRSLYKVEIPNVHADLEVAFNFREKDDRQIIIKDLRGIQKTGYSVEDRHLLDRFYTLTSNEQHKYNSYYTWGDSSGDSWYPSNNLVLYTVKPGYNPYNVSTAMSYDGGEKTTTGIRDYTQAGNPETIIYNAGNAGNGRYNTNFRYWGKNSTLIRKEEEYQWFNTYTELLLTTVAKDTANNWYAVALAQKDYKDQQLYLNATPYNYSLQLETASGDLNASGYTATTISGIPGKVYIENAKHTVEDPAAYLLLPTEIPIWDEDHVFEGWQLLAADGSETDFVFQSNEQVSLSEDIVAYAYGDEKAEAGNLTIRLQAVWKEIEHASTTSVSTKVYYQTPNPAPGKEITLDGKSYELVSDKTETQPVGEEIALINPHAPESSKYYELDPTSRLEGTTTNNPEDNELIAIYNLKFVTLDLQKTVYGTINASEFDITLKLNRPSNYPLSIGEAKTYINETSDTPVAIEVDGDSIIVTKRFSSGEEINLEGIPYGWTYEVVETKSNDANFETVITALSNSGTTSSEENSATLNGTLLEDTRIEVVNQRKNDDPNIVSDKWLTKTTDGRYDLTMETYAIGNTVTEEEADPVPLDIALVIDQSGSMATGDMGEEMQEVNDAWTVGMATSQEQYYYKAPNGKYYPVQAKEGTLYKAAPQIQIYDMFGRGHDSTVIDDFDVSAKYHYNVPTDYYAIDVQDGKAHKVYILTAGVFTKYYAYPYYYTNENQPWYNGVEGEKSVPYLSAEAWTAGQFMKTNDWNTFQKYGGTRSLGVIGWNYKNSDWVEWHDGVLGIGSYDGWYDWMDLAMNGDIRIVGQNSASISAHNAAARSYSWFSDGGTVGAGTNVPLFLPFDGYNDLYYIDDSGNPIDISNNVNGIAYQETDVVYTGKLYKPVGTTRVSALQDAVADFTKKVADNAREENLNHRIAIIGFAGNRVPALSGSGRYNYSGNNSKWDYVNSGLFINGNFKSYQQIDSFSSTSDEYINRHYYVTNNGYPESDNKEPILRALDGKWYTLAGSEKSISSTHFKPNYSGLSKDDYETALVPITDNDNGYFDTTKEINNEQNAAFHTFVSDVANKNGVNDYIDQSISKFGAYGGTYTSYGMTMANQLFANNSDIDDAGNKHKRIIIVFTDGEPGSNGYEEAIAGEALSDAKIAKEQYGATIYTVGLFKSATSDSVESFMKNLSSQGDVEKTNKYAGNSYGPSTQLDPNKTYYYTASDGKTYAVATKDALGQDTLGWWYTNTSGTSPSYSRFYPKEDSKDDRTGRVTFYSKSGNSYSAKYSFNEGETYYATSSHYPVQYEYRWYDSDKGVKDPKLNEEDAVAYHVQFFELSDVSEVGQQTYYYSVDNQAALESIFTSISEEITTNGTVTSLDPSNSAIRDVISQYFEWDNQTTYEKQAVEAVRADNSSPAVPKEGGSTTTIANKSGEWNASTRTLEITDFNFSETYITPEKEGQILRVTIHGLKPKASSVNGIFESNTGESGVYKYNFNEDGEKTSEKLIDAFPAPAISRYKYSIDVDGDDTAATYGTTFTWKDTENAPVESPDALMAYDPTNTETWKDNGVIQNVEGEQQKSIILEEIRDVDQFERLLQGSPYKHGDAIPDNYSIGFAVSGSNMDGNIYSFSKNVNNAGDEEYPADGTANPSGIMKKDGDSTVHISSKENRTTVSIQEITQPADPNVDYSDKKKEFTVIVTLMDREGRPVSYKNDDITFDDNGKTELHMKHNDAKTFEIPYGYKLAIDVLADTQEPYYDSYKENGVSKGTTYESGAITDYTSIQVINTLDAPDIASGVLDENNPFGIILAILAGICAIAAGVTVFYSKKRKKETEA